MKKKVCVKNNLSLNKAVFQSKLGKLKYKFFVLVRNFHFNPFLYFYVN